MAKKTTMQTFGLIVALGLIVASGPFLWSWQLTPKHGGLAVGKAMPAIEGVQWIGDPPPSLAGKVVVVNAWFLTCPFCHKGMPDLVKLHEKYRDRDDVVFVGLTYHEEAERRNVELFLEKYDAKWSNAYQAQHTLIGFEAEYFPGYWIIDRDGKVAWNKDSPEELADALARVAS